MQGHSSGGGGSPGVQRLLHISSLGPQLDCLYIYVALYSTMTSFAITATGES